MVTQLVIELVSQLINQPEDRIYFLIKKTIKNPQSLLQVSDCRYSVFIVYPKILILFSCVVPENFVPPLPTEDNFALDPHPPKISILGDVCHYPHPPPGIPTQSKLLLHHIIVRKIIVYAIKQRKPYYSC